jgi:2-keto-4-pentenoate hydratase/2-oxohepta-3-ene-1,7-dioic acid hydratase in catechol pathway
MQRKFREGGLPWELCKGFDGSAVIGDFVAKEELPAIQEIPFRLDINGETVQRGYSGDMIHSVDDIIAYVSRFFTLKIGDLLFTGTPVGVAPAQIGQHFEGYIQDRKVLDFNVR